MTLTTKEILYEKVFRGFILLIIVGILSACSSSTGVSQSGIQDKGKIVIATESEFAPFEFKTLIDGKDTLVGADIKLGNAIADALGVDADFSVMSFNNVLALVTSGKADFAIAGISVTDERKKAYDFSDAYYEAENIVIIKNRTRQPIPHLKVWQEKQLVRKKVQFKKTLRKTNCQIRALFP